MAQKEREWGAKRRPNQRAKGLAPPTAAMPIQRSPNHLIFNFLGVANLWPAGELRPWSG